LKEIFPSYERQGIFFYRGLYSGAKRLPVKKVFLFEKVSNSEVSDFGLLKSGSVIYYRGFCYLIERTVGITEEVQIYIGSPAPGCTDEKVVYPKSTCVAI